MSPVAHFCWLSRPHPATNTSARSASRKSFVQFSVTQFRVDYLSSDKILKWLICHTYSYTYVTKPALESGRHMGCTRPGTSLTGRRSLTKAMSFCGRQLSKIKRGPYLYQEIRPIRSSMYFHILTWSRLPLIYLW